MIISNIIVQLTFPKPGMNSVQKRDAITAHVATENQRTALDTRPTGNLLYGLYLYDFRMCE
jgi:hypothetical protein